MKPILFIDTEVDPATGRLLDIGACNEQGLRYQGKQIRELSALLKEADAIAGHNILQHDLKYLKRLDPTVNWESFPIIDTLLLSPLLFPKRPYHKLLKDDKLYVEELNNPYHDALKSMELWQDELQAWKSLPPQLQEIFALLLSSTTELKGFFQWLKFQPSDLMATLLIRDFFSSQICTNADIEGMATADPLALAYCLALIHADDRESLTPAWVLRNYPDADRFMTLLRGKPCLPGCAYCNEKLDIHKGLRRYFGFDNFRTFAGQNFQEQAVQAAVNGESLLVIFPTGGGKSITFQVPALIAGDADKGLTVVISPLQSLMKDQVDNLTEQGIFSAATINGLLDPLERAKAIEMVEDGVASLLYISPESLRSKTIERLLIKRKIARFVIDEAHCFSSWGQDFRVDYLYIGDFIRYLQKQKQLREPIPVSCFTATAKTKVIEDITSYFRNKLGFDLRLFNAGVARTNLQYHVLQCNDDQEKMQRIYNLLDAAQCPTIIYVSRTKKARLIAEKLINRGYNASYYHGKLAAEDKVEHQDQFIKGETDIIVATSAFGMGVDKKDVGMVIHFDISDSLENYVQEAGRAGRDEKIQAACYVLFNEEDLNKHFILLNETRLQLNEIKDIWKAIKSLTKYRKTVTQSALEIAREAGWDDEIYDLETRVKTAIAALEDAGYLERKQNSPRIFATSILSKNAQEAINKIERSPLFTSNQRTNAIRIIKRLFSSKKGIREEDEEAESRVDYLSDKLGIVREDVIQIIYLLREEKILADTKDLNVFIKHEDSENKSRAIALTFIQLEHLLLEMLREEPKMLNIKDLNERAETNKLKDINTRKIIQLLNYWSVRKWLKLRRDGYNKNYFSYELLETPDEIARSIERHSELSSFIIDYLFEKNAQESPALNFVSESPMVSFSVHELRDAYSSTGIFGKKLDIAEIEEALFFLSRIKAIDIEGGFMVIHNRLTIERKQDKPNLQYKKEDYKKLDEFYQQKVEQIHIVGEYAKKRLQSYEDALSFVEDYFKMGYGSFIQKHFKGERAREIRSTLTPAKFKQIFGELSTDQLNIIRNSESQYIVVAAGPGSGKTKVLVHKLASLLLMEQVKQEDLLMLTFSRAAASEFRERLMKLVGNAVSFLHIKTFHSWCFELLGRNGSISKSEQIITEATDKIKQKEVPSNRVNYRVMVIDEAQDIAPEDRALIEALMEHNPDMKIIAVGDDDQNIYAFRNADNRFLIDLTRKENAIKYELTTNYRSLPKLVAFTQAFVESIPERLKTTPSQSFHKGNEGEVQILACESRHLFAPLMKAMEETRTTGTTAVLCPTNEDTFTIAALLQQEGLKVRIIQQQDGFSLYDLQELRYFTHLIKKYDQHEIDEKMWAEAIAKLQKSFSRSHIIPNCLEIIGQFEKTHRVKKNFHDWMDYLWECSLDDFMAIDSETIYVSTYHKAKGREFDNVFILSRFPGKNASADEKRKLYVAMTRARSKLHITIHGNGLDWLPHHLMEYTEDTFQYNEPEIITLSAGLDDVWLDFFSNKINLIRNLEVGDKLELTESGCAINGNELLRFSKKFKEEISQWKKKGYMPFRAHVNYIVFWQKENEPKEWLTVLPVVDMRKG